MVAQQYSQDDPFLLATAGDKGVVAVWESDELAAVENYFNARVTAPSTTYGLSVSPLAAVANDVGAAVVEEDQGHAAKISEIQPPNVDDIATVDKASSKKQKKKKSNHQR